MKDLLMAKRYTDEENINRLKLVHGDKHTYLNIYLKKEKTKPRSYSYCDCKCNTCGHEWTSRFNGLLHGQGCPKCANIFFNKFNEKKRLNAASTFIDKSNIKHDNFYQYHKVVYLTNRIKVIIVCPIHGEFKQTPNMHLEGKGCPHCKASKGEKLIEQILKKNNIPFKSEQTFPNLLGLNGGKLRFDFYIDLYKIAIEFNGMQHDQPIAFRKNKEKAFDDFVKRNKHDNIKKQYCKDNNITLIIVSYLNTPKEIEQIINDTINTCKAVADKQLVMVG